ncbi:uncharacterized protein B0I36DRAFT_403091 [Microdochium trichocladiopsis]|uniref:Ferric reductase like transmembrane component-domain-containing protein n=1 Tax=Microdochium trichocladiopsis TaxID=1682393 RepID=A0A9P8YDX4_9PEZI|nr:uncharacterized protein B0I36DRAFT_403091 [Microdochium trichocladiopsis]KAH7037548.1 hypothetical protein B0I36DRAFT_403091 [Microdochium trichocladiopsis]
MTPWTVLLLLLLADPARSDGIGMIGIGKTLYHPTCAFACRNVVRNCPLSCTPAPEDDDAAVNHGTVHNPVVTPPSCFVSDPAFLKTVALCIDNYCPHSRGGQAPPSPEVIADYWAGHLGTGTLGTPKWVPAMSFEDALRAARRDEATAAAAVAPGHGNSTMNDNDDHGGDHGAMRRFSRRHGGVAMDGEDMDIGAPDVSSVLPAIAAKKPLNVTSFIVPNDWQIQYNGMWDFETNENGHTIYSVVIAAVAVALPVMVSLLRFLPTSTRTSYFFTTLKAALIQPAVLGTKHREPVLVSVTGGAIAPTRGQALYILLIGLLNIIFLLGPYVATHPQSTFVSVRAQSLSVIGNRAGVMAMGNAVALYTFAMRNNPLALVFGGGGGSWSRSTYLLLHRWLGYWVILHTVLHSVLLLAYYKLFGAYEVELVRQYWIWGIVGTVAVCAIFPTSLLVVRRRAYEFFLTSHVFLSLLFLVGYYYHIWYCYEYKWGYEIWMFVAAALWAMDWMARMARVLVKGRGMKLATVTVVGEDYLHIRVDGVGLEDGGFAYLCFPTLSWKFWEAHPFSVAYSTPASSAGHARNEDAAIQEHSLAQVAGTEKLADKDISADTASSSPPSSITSSTSQQKVATHFFARTRAGMTAQLAKRVAAIPGEVLQLRVLVEGAYHSGAQPEQAFRGCERLVCIAGGVGVTAVLPYLQAFTRDSASGRFADFYWGLRLPGLLEALQPELDKINDKAKIETAVGTRLDLEQILRKALLPTQPSSSGHPDQCFKGKTVVGTESVNQAEKAVERKLPGDGLVGIVVCGPPSMADDVRAIISRLARQETMVRPYIFVDEAFSW